MGIINKGFTYLEETLSVNWFNPIATLYLNFRLLPLRQALLMPIWCYGRPRFYNLSGTMIIHGDVCSGMIKLGKVRYGAPSSSVIQSELSVAGTVIVYGRAYIGTGTKIVVAYNAILEIGSYCEITDMVNIGCMERIKIGNSASITHRCQIMDSDYHYLVNLKDSNIPRCSHPIVIGDCCWICNNSTIMGGSVLPAGSIVASNSLVNKDFSGCEKDSLFAGIPAEYKKNGYHRVFNLDTENEIFRYFEMNHAESFRFNADMRIDNIGDE